jgi:DNA-directed RNA polymerase II subunit RPB1
MAGKETPFCIDSKVGRLESVDFEVLGDDDILNMSTVEVISNKQIKSNSEPFDQGIYDGNMGAIFKFPCESCLNKVERCPGHSGHYKLNWPLMHPFYLVSVTKWIKVICTTCFRICCDVDIKTMYADFDPNNNRPGSYVIDYLNDKLKKRAKHGLFCDHCNNAKQQSEQGVTQISKFVRTIIQPTYRTSVICDYFLEHGEKKKTVTVYTHDMLAIFESMPDSELIKLGLDARYHPKRYICRLLYIPPICIRFINNTKKSAERINTITAKLEAVITNDKKLPSDIGDSSNHDFGSHTDSKSKLYTILRIIDAYDKYIGVNIDANADAKAANGLFASMKGKHGRIKGDTLGKLAGKVFRMVIACDTTVPIDTVLIPRKFASTLTLEETVTPYNIERLRKIVANGDVYPGCPSVYSIQRKYVAFNKGDHVLVCGDVVNRHLVDGDEVSINRSPSLLHTSTVAVKILVWKGKEDINYAGINVLVCPLFKADFDGDAMSGKLYGREHIREEASILLSMDRFMLTHETSSPIIGQNQDSILGLTLLTTHGVSFSRLEAMKLFRNVVISTRLTKESYTGREILSMVMPSINYDAPSPMFKNPLVAKFGNFHESDYKVVIVNGEIRSGILCGSIIKPSANSIYHVICNMYGPQAMNNVIYQHQQVSKAFLEINGTTISYADVRMSAKSKQMIQLIQDAMLREYSEMNNKIITNSLVAPPGKSLEDHIEDEALRILNPGDKYMAAILLSARPKENWIFQMVYSGTKGSLGNFYNMFAPIGQLKIEGKRLRTTLDIQHASIHYRQFSLNPQARGYVHTSVKEGMESSTSHFVGMELRRNTLIKSKGTAQGGTIGKTITRMMESTVIDYRLFTVRGYGANIIEFNILGDGFRSSSLFWNTYIAYSMSQDELTAKYGKRATLIATERDELLAIQSNLFYFNPLFKQSDKFMLPIDLLQVLYTDSTTKHPGDDEKMTMLDDFCDNIHYCRINSIHRRKKTVMPQMMTCAFTALRIILRANITPHIASVHTVEQFRMLLAYAEHFIIKAFFSPGDPIGVLMAMSYTRPLTQHLIDAHHNSATGGTPRDELNYQTELLSGKASADTYIKKMMVFLQPQYEQSRENAERLASYITSKRLSEIITMSQIIYEQWNEHFVFPEDKDLLNAFLKMSTDVDYSAKSLNGFKFRYTLSRKLMFDKDVVIEDICNKIEHRYKDKINLAYFIDPLDNDQMILMMFFADDFDWDLPKSNDTEWEKVFRFNNTLIDTLTINEFKGISAAIVKQTKFAGKTIYFIETKGINLEEVLLIRCVDSTRTTCNNPTDTFYSEGLIACKMKVMNELYNTFNDSLGLTVSNYSLLSSLMIETGLPTPITEVGLKEREADDILLRAAMRDPRKAFTEAALNCITTQMTSMSAHQMVGQTPRHLGTNYPRMVLNEEFVMANSQSDNLADLI